MTAEPYCSRRFLAGLFAMVAVTHAAAWGTEGHETIGAIADVLVAGSPAGEQVRGILFSGETLSKASIWADCAKGYCGRLTEEMQDFVNANPRHHNYHFTDLPFEADRYIAGAVGTDPDDAVQILRQAIDVLAGQANSASNPHGFTRRQALLLIVHLVGDIHQPLHVGTAYINEDDEFAVPQSTADFQSGIIQETHGDNYLMIGSRNLHSYWDGDLVKRAMRRAHATTPEQYAIFLLQKYPQDAIGQEAVTTWPLQWANESLQLSKEAHRDITLGEREEAQDRSGSPHLQWQATLPRDYAKRSTDRAEQQLAKAGRRLANLLMGVWR